MGVPTERDVLRLRLGLDSGGQLTRREVGQICGKTTAEIRSIERQSLTKIRKADGRGFLELRSYLGSSAEAMYDP